MWTQSWPITELKQVDREARKIVVENGGKHPRSIKIEYKETKVKAAVKL